MNHLFRFYAHYRAIMRTLSIVRCVPFQLRYFQYYLFIYLCFCVAIITVAICCCCSCCFEYAHKRCATTLFVSITFCLIFIHRSEWTRVQSNGKSMTIFPCVLTFVDDFVIVYISTIATAAATAQCNFFSLIFFYSILNWQNHHDELWITKCSFELFKHLVGK